MSGEVNNNNNNEISIQELQQQLVNVEETEHKTVGTKSIFNAYNTQKQLGENEIERLTKQELDAFVQKLQSYDLTSDGKLDANEIDAFVRDFNKEHPNDRIASQDVLLFVDNILKKKNLYNSGNISYKPDVKKVGDPLSSKTVRLQCLNENNEVVEIMLQIDLFATEDEHSPLLYQTKVVQGAEYKNLLANKYGYSGENAWNNFTTGSLRAPNAHTYDVKFTPTSAKKDVYTTGEVGGVSQVYGLDRGDGIDSYIMVDWLDRDPKVILAEYQNPKAQEAMNEFITYLEGALNDTEKVLDDCIDKYGFSAEVAEFVSKLWNDSDEAGSGTEEQVRNSIAEARELLAKMKETLKEDSNANTMEGILRREDFGAYYQRLTGKDFRVRKIMDFMEAKNEYLQAQSVLAMHTYVHKNLNSAITMFEEISFDDAAQEDAILQSGCSSYKNYPFSVKDKEFVLKSLGEAFYPVLGISPEDWIKVMDKLESQGIDPIKFCRDLFDNIITATDAQVGNLLGTTNPTDMKNKVSSYELYYNNQRSDVVGNGDMMDVVGKYHKSQMLGSALVSGLCQVGLYAVAMTLCPASAPAIVSGLCSGTAYATSYALVESVDRMTNNIDNSIDMWSSEALLDLAETSAIEFAAAFAFDGIFKKAFSNPEKMLLNKDKMMTVQRIAEPSTNIGEGFISKFGVKFGKEKITQIMKMHGLAGVIGGSKDSLKETFKESIRQKFNLKTICSTFLVGAISNALFIKFKNSAFSKQNHKIMGRFLETGLKKESNAAIKDRDVQLSSDELEMINLINEIRTQVIGDIRTQAQQDRQYSELLEFVLDNELEVNKLILSCYIIDNFLEYSGY